MAQIVCISDKTVRPGIQEVGDIVEVQDDNVQLTGSGYECFRVIKVPGISAKQVRNKLATLTPTLDTQEINGVFITYWYDQDTWRKLVNRPKFLHNIKNITLADTEQLANTTLSDSARLSVLEVVHTDKITVDPANLLGSILIKKL